LTRNPRVIVLIILFCHNGPAGQEVTVTEIAKLHVLEEIASTRNVMLTD